MTFDRVGKSVTAAASSSSSVMQPETPSKKKTGSLPSSSSPLRDAVPTRTSPASGTRPPRSPSLQHEIDVDDQMPLEVLQEAASVATARIVEHFDAEGAGARERYIEACEGHGATSQQLADFETKFGAHFIPSASAGKQLASLNDHAGILKIPAYDGPPDRLGRRSVVAEQLTVIKATVPHRDPAQAGSERYFVKGYGDRLVDFRELATAMAAHSPLTEGLDEAAVAAHFDANKLGERENAMETPLRSEIKRLSLKSELIARRDGRESDQPVMPLPFNATAVASRESWANSEAAMCPGAGPMLPNGTRKFQVDYNATENRLVIFRNDRGEDARSESILSDSLPGARKKLAPAFCEGPTLAEIHGILSWEDMGPGTDHKGVKQGNTQRLLHAAHNKMFGQRAGVPAERDLEAGPRDPAGLREAVVRAEPGAHIRITTEDGSVHDMHMDEKGIRLSLSNPQPAGEHHESLAAFGGAGKVQAEVDLYTYHGRDTGLRGSKTGFADPRLVTSTGESLKAGPLLKDHGPTLGQTIWRVTTFQPLINGQDRSRVVARLTNTAVNMVAKFLVVWGTSTMNTALKGGSHGSYLPGVKPINSSGAGAVGNNQLALAAASIVMAQEGITLAMDAVGRLLPEPWRRAPESRTGRLLKETVAPMAEEMLRLVANLGIQKRVGIHRGSRADLVSLGATSMIKGGMETWREHAGPNRAHHPVANAVVDLAQGLQYNAARAAGNAGSSAQGLSAKTFGEALINRMVTRALDQIVAPAVRDVLNSQGVVGANASAFDSQLAHEYRIDHLAAKVGSAMAALVTELDAQGVKDLHAQDGSLVATLHAGTESLLADTIRNHTNPEFFSKRILVEERVKQNLNRVDLYVSSLLNGMLPALAKMGEAIDTELHNDPSIRDNVQNAGAFTDAPTAEKLEQLQRNDHIYRQRVGEAREGLGLAEESRPLGAYLSPASQASPFSPNQESQLLAHRSPAMDNPLDGLTPPQQAFAKDRIEALGEHVANLEAHGRNEADDHSRFDASSMVQRPVPAAANVDYGRVARPFGAGPSAQIGRDHTTFSTLPQWRALQTKNRAMIRQPGIDSVRTKSDLPASVVDRIEKAVRDYTVESQLFHYPLRWQVTGELQHERIAPGIDVAYNVMHKKGNMAGSKKEMVDPIEALYINLGAQVSDKFPTEMFRAVVTEAAYKALLEAGESSATPGLMTEGNKGVLTEILSATMSMDMAAGFNLPISSYGSAPRENSLRIDLSQESGVNIAAWADLVQGEVIMVPGAVLQVDLIDKTAGKGGKLDLDPAKSQDIGQVVYMKAVDTYALEQAHDQYMLYRTEGDASFKPRDGETMIDPASGHFYKFNQAKDALEPVPETKNYFTGRTLEWTDDEGRHAAGQARWRRPYTADGATRATKDAIHMAMLRGDPIVPYLDLATENVHHAWYRKKAQMKIETGQQDPRVVRASYERERREELRHAGIRAEAGEIARQIGGMNANTRLGDSGVASTEMMAWLCASMLRKPIQLVPVDDRDTALRMGDLGDARKNRLISRTYDKVDLASPRESVTGRNPQPAVLIGVGDKGYYVITHQDGEFKPTARVGEGTTLDNLLHAVVRGGYAKPSQYVTSEADHVLTPDTRAQASVQGLIAKMKQFTGTGYLVLQQALVDKAAELTPPPAPI